ncbi:MAG: cadherin-like beta sandwich domain-containing protein [Verrucomicrobiota bacterium]
MTAVRNIDGISLFKDASLSIREGGGRLFRYLSVLFFLGSLSIDPLNAASQTSEPETINPAEWLAAQKKPSFRDGYTLPRLTRFGWTLPESARVELAKNWGYALEFGGYVDENTIAKLANPNSTESRMVALAKSDPQRYPLSVICSRRMPEQEAPDSAWCHDEDGKLLLGDGKSMDGTPWSGDNTPVFSPEAPDSVWLLAGSYRATPLQSLQAQLGANAPISIVLNGGEYGLGVPGWASGVWAKDPKVLDAAKPLGWTGKRPTLAAWAKYGSTKKAHSEKLIADKVREVTPNRSLYVYYTAGGRTLRNKDWSIDSWGPIWEDMRGVSDLPSNEVYYKSPGSNHQLTGRLNLLTCALNAVGAEIPTGNTLSYNWISGGWVRGNEEYYVCDMERWTGFLKCYYTAGMIGANVGYYEYPEAQTLQVNGGTVNISAGFGARFPADQPPVWLRQMVASSHVHALFSQVEDLVRNGDLLPGPMKHSISTSDPAYEFPTGDETARVLVRKHRTSPSWLVTAWVSAGEDRDVVVNVPELGRLTLGARSCGSVYKATLADDEVTLTQLDMEGSTYTNVALSTGTPVTRPVDLTVGLPPVTGRQVWVAADNGVVKDGAGKVSAWSSQGSLENFVVQQAQTAKQPLWVADAVNGRPGLKFDKAKFTLSALLDEPAGSEFKGPLTIFTVFTGAVERGDHRVVSGIIQGGNDYTASGFKVTDGAGSSLEFANGVMLNTTKDRLTKNNVDAPLERLGFGGMNGGTGGVGFTGYLSEVLIYNGSLPETQGALVRQYLKEKYASSNAALAGLTVSGGTLSAEFRSGLTDYAVTVPNETIALSVTPVVANTTASVKVNGASVTAGAQSTPVVLTVGSNVVSVEVTAQDGITKKTYSVNVTRLPSSNAGLAGLMVSEGTVSPGFVTGVTDYAVTVPYATSAWSVTPVVANATASVKVNGGSVASGSPSAPMLLNVGSNVVSVEVTAQDGTTKKTYTMNVTRLPSSNAGLAGLTVNGGTLSPGFASDVTSYAVSVPYAVSTWNVTPVVADPTASVKVNGIALESGSPSAPVVLSVGLNVVSVEVTAQDGVTKKTYTASVTRGLPSTNASLSGLFPSAGSLGPVFKSDVSAYALKFTTPVVAMKLKPVTSYPGATVKVNGTLVASGTWSGSLALGVGETVLPVVVTAEDGLTQRSYVVSVSRPAGTSAALTNLTASSVSLSPLFNAGSLTYSSKVWNSVSSTKVTATVSSGATVKVNGTLVQSGSPSAAINLVEGMNLIEVLVTAEDGVATKTYTVSVIRQPACAGGYDGLVVPNTNSTSPRQNVGRATATLTSAGAFTGNVVLGGTATSTPFSGVIDIESGLVSFNVSAGPRTPLLEIARAGFDPLTVNMRVDWQTPLTHQLVGEVRSGSLVVSEFVLNRRLYTSAVAPVAPLKNVPLTVLDPVSDKGAYTMVFPAWAAAVQGRAASEYPQGSGWATAVVSATGLVTVTGELADGQVFSASNYLSKEKRLPFYVMPYGGIGVVAGEVSFRDVAGKSDVDGGGGLRWYKPANAGDPLYAQGWAAGIGLDLVGSKFLAAPVTLKTVLGNEPAAFPAVNGVSELSSGGLQNLLSTSLTIKRTGAVTAVMVQGAPAGGLSALNEVVVLGTTGKVSGSFTYPGASSGWTAFRGAVLQKAQSAGGYFLSPVVGGKPAESGVVRLWAQ